VLLDPELVEKVIDAYWTDERPKTYVIDLGWRLLSIARDSGALNQVDLARLEDLRATLEEHRKLGLTPKNQTAVRAILSGHVWREMVDLPERLILQHQDRRITDASYIRATLFEAAQQFGKMLRGQ
jgi:hypothetical protein